jgi:hypothetical protein
LPLIGTRLALLAYKLSHQSPRTQSAWLLARAVNATLSGQAELAENLAAKAAEYLARAIEFEATELTPRVSYDRTDSPARRMRAFNEDTAPILAEAFNAACIGLPSGQPSIVYEVVARRIIDAAQRGEKNVSRLAEVGLAGVVFE